MQAEAKAGATHIDGAHKFPCSDDRTGSTIRRFLINVTK
jgi:hypothetical protein